MESISPTAPSMEATDDSPRPSKGACKRCHDRKVKCDIGLVGRPCTGCRKDEVICEFRSRKSYAPRKRRRQLPPEGLNNNHNLQANPYPIITIDNRGYRQATSTSHVNSGSDNNHNSDHRGRDGITQLLDGVHRQGIGYILDAAALDAATPRPNLHEYPKHSMAQHTEPNDLTYLDSKGVFKLPPVAVCDELIVTYFRFIHPLVPILDSSEFISTYERNGVNGSNLLLLWSVFHAASSYVSEAALAQTGHKVRKDLKAECYSKSKLLFVQDTELDPAVVIQSALLLGLWLPTPEDRAPLRSWVDVAIGVAQDSTFHRDHERDSSVTPRHRRHWRRLWWICVFRDRWNSFTNARPMRIQLDDCDVQQSGTEDITDEDDSIPDHVRAKYGLLEFYANDWTRLMKLTAHLGEILSHNYKPKTKPLSYIAMARLEDEILYAIPLNLESQATTSSSTLLAQQLSLYRDVVLIALYRKSALKIGPPPESFTTSTIASTTTTLARTDARNKLRAAAASCNSTMERIIGGDGVPNLVPHLAPTTLALTVPIMQTYATEARTMTFSARTIALGRLDFWCELLREVSDTFPAAEGIRRGFLMIKQREGSSANVGVANMGRGAAEGQQQYEERAAGEGTGNLNWESTPE